MDGVTPEPVAAPEPRASGLQRPWLIIGVAVAVVAVAALGAFVLHRHDSSAKGPALTLEPSDAAGQNPFTDSVAVGTTAAFPKDVLAVVAKVRSKLPVSKKTQTRVASGTAPGVYGGNGATRVCDSQALITYLQKNPGNATAWAKAAGVPRNNIAIFVTSLTPVVLMNDTRVTNHGYENAAIAPRQSVLQAGTAVMVDIEGVPRVVCNSGNPVSATRPIVIKKTRGAKWSGFDPKAVVTIVPGPSTHTLSLVNTETGAYYQQPTGNGSAAPISVTGQWVVAEPYFVGGTLKSTTIVAISTGRPWVPTAVIPGEGVAGIAWGDGKWVAVTNANYGGKGNHVLVSTDLHTWKQVAALPNRLSSIAFGNGRWTATALHTTPAIGPTGVTHTSGVVYTSTDATHWTQVAETGGVANGRRQPVAYGNGEWLTVVATNDTSTGTPVPTLLMYTSLDGQHWTANGGEISGQLNPSLAFGPRIWAIGSTPAVAGNAVISTSTDGINWTPSSAGLKPAGMSAIASGNTRWMGVIIGSAGRPASTFVTSDDAKTWTVAGIVRTPVSAIAFGAKTASDANAPIGAPESGGTTGATGTTGASGATTSPPPTTASSARVPQ